MCTCGKTTPHTIATRTTFDGIIVHMWDDGAITGALGVGLRGVPLRRPSTPEAVHRARVAGRLLLGDCCLYSADELGELYAAAERAARLDGLPGTMRRILRERQDRKARPKLTWIVTSADRDGRPVERTARLPRLRWPGMVIFDYCGGPGSSGGRYHLCARVHGAGNTYQSTGFAFSRLATLWAHLESL